MIFGLCNSDNMNEHINDFEKAGKLTAQIRERSKKLIKPGAKLLDIAETIESWIKKENAQFSFPVNLSLNENAAHYTPPVDDDTILTENDVIKVDLGAAINGCAGDSAYTIDLSGEYGDLLEASETAMENIISSIKAGKRSNDFGQIAEETITMRGFKVISNLSGHKIEQNNLHGGTIPMTKSTGGFELQEGDILAIEPFASTGQGYVKDGSLTEIFSFERQILTRNLDARKLLEDIQRAYPYFPFAERWLIKGQQSFKSRIALRELITRGALRTYAVLHDNPGSKIAQFEKSVIVEKDSCRVIT